MTDFCVYAYLDHRKPGIVEYGGANPIKKNKIDKILSSGQTPILMKVKDPLTNFSKSGETFIGYKHKDYIDRNLFTC